MLPHPTHFGTENKTTNGPGELIVRAHHLYSHRLPLNTSTLQIPKAIHSRAVFINANDNFSLLSDSFYWCRIIHDTMVHPWTTEVTNRVNHSGSVDDADNGSTEAPVALDPVEHCYDPTNQECIPGSNSCKDFVWEAVKADHPIPQEEEGAVATDEDDDESQSCDDDEDFDMNGISLPKLSSSTIPIILDVSNAHKGRGFYSSDDPLFQGICLYSSTTDNLQNQDGVDTSSSVTMIRNDFRTPTAEERDLNHVPATSETMHHERSNTWYTRFVPPMFR
jgi:hypothetical protein